MTSSQPIDEASDFELPRHRRLLTPRDFRQVYRRGRRVRGPHLIVVALERRDPDFRLGLSVSKANGRAPRRNKIKRIFREAFRLGRPSWKGQYDIILIPQPQERYELDAIRLELNGLIAKLATAPRPHRRRRR